MVDDSAIFHIAIVHGAEIRRTEEIPPHVLLVGELRAAAIAARPWLLVVVLYQSNLPKLTTVLRVTVSIETDSLGFCGIHSETCGKVSLVVYALYPCFTLALVEFIVVLGTSSCIIVVGDYTTVSRIVCTFHLHIGSLEWHGEEVGSCLQVSFHSKVGEVYITVVAS